MGSTQEEKASGGTRPCLAKCRGFDSPPSQTPACTSRSGGCHPESEKRKPTTTVLQKEHQATHRSPRGQPPHHGRRDRDDPAPDTGPEAGAPRRQQELVRRRCSHPATRLAGTHATQRRAATHPFYGRARAHVGPPPAGHAAPCSHPATPLPGTHATHLRAATHPFYRRARAHIVPPPAGRAPPWGITWRTPRLPRTTGRRCLGPCRWRRALCSAPPAPFFRCTTVASTRRVPRRQ